MKTILDHLPTEDEIQKVMHKEIFVLFDKIKTVWDKESLKVPYDPQVRGGVRYSVDEIVERIKGDVHGRF